MSPEQQRPVTEPLWIVEISKCTWVQREGEFAEHDQSSGAESEPQCSKWEMNLKNNRLIGKGLSNKLYSGLSTALEDMDQSKKKNNSVWQRASI